MGIAAPIRGSETRRWGAVHLSPPTSRWTMEAKKTLYGDRVRSGDFAVDCALSQLCFRSCAL
jgi:DNA-binding IclR family transcriptional regulator